MEDIRRGKEDEKNRKKGGPRLRWVALKTDFTSTEMGNILVAGLKEHF